MKSSRETFTAVFAFCCCLLALTFGLSWAWSAFQDRSVAASLPARPMVSVEKSRKVDTGLGHLVATESVDAASANILASVRVDLPDLSASLDRADPVPHVSPVKKNQEDQNLVSLVHKSLPNHSSLPVLNGASVIPASLPDSKLTHQSLKDSEKDSFKNPRLAIIIDDMGMAVKNSQRVTHLPAPITLSYLPYAPDIQGQVDRASAKGHEIMLHLPMEAFDSSMDPGPAALTSNLLPQELHQNLLKNLNAFHGYVGVNNHMGSRLTSLEDAMKTVIGEIDRRNVYFVDSWTSPRSVAYRVAAKQGVSRARRDVFLDHFEGEKTVWNALKQAEHLARRHGSAIVIGHPKNDTINVLQAWLPGAIARGVEIVPVSKLVYNGSMNRDPVLIADAARQEQNRPNIQKSAENMARITPASGR